MSAQSESVTAIIQQMVEGRITAEQGSRLLHSLVAEAELSMRNKLHYARLRTVQA